MPSRCGGGDLIARGRFVWVDVLVMNGEGWIANQDLKQLCQSRPASMSTHAKWVQVQTFHWKPPCPPVPKTSRWMLGQNAIHAWQTMLKTGWVRCRPPVR